MFGMANPEQRLVSHNFKHVSNHNRTDNTLSGGMASQQIFIPANSPTN